jgi:5-methylthioadenosine/S-adenosylhomocysteine deaminase
MQPIINIPKNLVYSGSRDCVKLTMIAGKVLYEDGKFFIGEEPESIYETCAKIVAEMTA